VAVVENIFVANVLDWQFRAASKRFNKIARHLAVTFRSGGAPFLRPPFLPPIEPRFFGVMFYTNAHHPLLPLFWDFVQPRFSENSLTRKMLAMLKCVSQFECVFFVREPG